jgi:hypothetical protein
LLGRFFQTKREGEFAGFGEHDRALGCERLVGPTIRPQVVAGPASVHGLIAQNLRLDEGDELLGLAANFLRM